MMLTLLLVVFILIPLLQNQFCTIFGKFGKLRMPSIISKNWMTSLGYLFAFVGYIPLILLTLYRFKDTSKLWKISSIVFFIFVAVFLCFSSQLSNWKKWINILCTAVGRLYHPYNFINFFAISKQCVWKKNIFLLGGCPSWRLHEKSASNISIITCTKFWIQIYLQANSSQFRKFFVFFTYFPLLSSWCVTSN